MPGISASSLRRVLQEAMASGGIAHEMGYGSTRSGALLGAPIGAVAQYISDPDEDNLAPGLATGALLGAAGGRGLRTLGAVGAGVSGGLREALSQYAVSRGTRRLASIKREALDYVRNNPVAVQRVMAAKDADEIDAIVNDVVSRTRVRGYGNY